MKMADVIEVAYVATRRGRALLGGPRTHGVLCVVTNNLDELLLVKPRYRGWGIVAGFCDPDEDPLLAAVRELQEEAGIDHVALELIGHRARRAHDDHIMRAVLPDTPILAPRSWEIAAARWVSVDNLPPLHRTSQWAIELAGIRVKK